MGLRTRGYRGYLEVAGTCGHMRDYFCRPVQNEYMRKQVAKKGHAKVRPWRAARGGREFRWSPGEGKSAKR